MFFLIYLYNVIKIKINNFKNIIRCIKIVLNNRENNLN